MKRGIVENRIEPTSRHWLLAGAAATVLLGVWLHRAPLADLARIALYDPEQSHILLVPIVALWLLWLRRYRFDRLPLHPSLLGPIIAGCGWMLSWGGYGLGWQAAWHAGALLTLVGCVVSFTGPAVLRRFAPVFGLLVFAVPVPASMRQQLDVPLQAMAATVTTDALQLLGVPVVRTGNVLVVEQAHVAVGEACNGLRLVFALALVGYAFVFSSPLRASTRLLLLALCPLIALLCNVARLVPTALFYGYVSTDRAEWFHDLSGWLMLPIALLLLLHVIWLLKWMDFRVTRYRLASR